MINCITIKTKLENLKDLDNVLDYLKEIQENYPHVSINIEVEKN